MTTCPKASPVRCEVDWDAIRQEAAVKAFAQYFSIWPDVAPQGLVLAAFNALRPCPSDLTLCEVAQCP